MPCTNRSTTSRIGAAIPITPQPGRTPTRKVLSPIINNETIKIVFRPIRSPKWPNSAAPNGRAMNATAKVEKAASVPVTGSSAGKNALFNTSAAARPYA